ncbi:MAG: TIGR01212 family radical SAM protein [Candidatus Aphodosoma sp.]
MYLNYNTILRRQFGARVQKISVNAGFSCPNRDGTLGWGGCTFCNNRTFNPGYCLPEKSVCQQMQEGMEFFSRYESQLYLAYFQAYTNTYAPLDELRRVYEPVLDMPGVVGIVVATRPDCVDGKLLDYFAGLSEKCYVMIEYGLESTDDETLLRINRGHNYAKSVEAVTATAGRGINTGAHLILGLPGEGRDDILRHADRISRLPLDMLKLHQLQIVRGTRLAQQWTENPDFVHLYTLDEYIDLCIDFLDRLSPRIAIERFVSQSPAGMLLAPDWGIKNYEFVDRLHKRMESRSMSR